MSFPILTLTENACRSLAQSALTANGFTTVQVFTGLDTETKAAPCVVCYAEEAKEHFPFSGLYEVTTRIMVKEMAADSDPTSGLADTIFHAFLTEPDTQSTLSSYPGYNCYKYWVQDTRDTTSGDAWIKELNLMIVGVIT